MKKIITGALLSLVFTLFTACGGPGIIPEMKEFTAAFTSKDKITAAVEKFGTPEVLPEALKSCDLEKPIIKKTEKKDGIIYYTTEARVAACDKSENAVGTIRVFVVGWKNGKIVAFKWGGPKDGKVEY